MGSALNDLAYAVNDTIKDPANFKALNVLIQEMINASVVQALNNTFGTEDMLPLNVLLNNAIANHGTQTFTSNGTFVVPEGVYKILVTGAGGGASGSARNNTSKGCAGGAGGACIFKRPFAVTPGQSISITIGSGGAAVAKDGGAGKAGGSTVVGSLITLPGGGAPSSAFTTGVPGDGGGAGGIGGQGVNSSTYGVYSSTDNGQDGLVGRGGIGGTQRYVGKEGGEYEGGGGGGSFGNGGAGARRNQLAATAGTNGGGGGGGCYDTASAAGGKGIVIIEW